MVLIFDNLIHTPGSKKTTCIFLDSAARIYVTKGGDVRFLLSLFLWFSPANTFRKCNVTSIEKLLTTIMSQRTELKTNALSDMTEERVWS